jgi:hypothetical protein
VRRSDSAPDLPRAASFSRLLGSLVTIALLDTTVWVEPSLHVWPHENAALNPKQSQHNEADGETQPDSGAFCPNECKQNEADKYKAESGEPNQPFPRPWLRQEDTRTKQQPEHPDVEAAQPNIETKAQESE